MVCTGTKYCTCSMVSSTDRAGITACHNVSCSIEVLRMCNVLYTLQLLLSQLHVSSVKKAMLSQIRIPMLPVLSLQLFDCRCIMASITLHLISMYVCMYV